MRPRYALLLVTAAALSVFLPACSPSEGSKLSVTPSPSSDALVISQPAPTQTTPATTSSTKASTPVQTTTPLPTPTPRLHTVKAGEEMLAIALEYNIMLEALMSANPDVDPGLLVVGTTLVIPSNAGTGQEASEPSGPLPITLSPVNCLPQLDGGAWCFLTAHNPLEVDVFSVSVEVSIGSTDDQPPQSQQAVGLLNRLPAGTSLPLAAFFPAPVPPAPQTSAKLLSAQRTAIGEETYLEVAVINLQVDIRPGELMADISGEFLLEGDLNADVVWLLAAAFDEEDHLIGIRRWESDAPLLAGAEMPFSVRVYSAGGAISRALVTAEAHR